MRRWHEWVPATVLAVGLVLAMGVRETQPQVLRAPLTSVPDTLLSYPSVSLTLAPEELKVNGASEYLLRAYVDAAGQERFGLYVGYYPQQSQGKTIHSPKNCLPGGGWEPISHEIVSVPVGAGSVPVNRYVIGREGQQAIVYYWYQGRSRVAADEYAVKWDLLRDAAFKARSEEALVRLVIPLGADQSEADADLMAHQTIGSLVSAIYRALPA